MEKNIGRDFIISLLTSLFGLFLCLFLIIMPNAFNKNIYKNCYTNGLVASTNYSIATLDNLLDNSLDYVYGTSDKFQITVEDMDHNTINYPFTLKEEKHMEELRIAFITLRYVFVFSLLVFLSLFAVLISTRKKATKCRYITALVVVSSFTLLALFLIGYGIINFNSLWFNLHTILFPNLNWLLSNDSLLLHLTPTKAFSIVAIRSGVLVTILLALTYIFLILKIKKKD